MTSLRIQLHGRDVGILRKDTRTSFKLSETYLEQPQRPILGQAFEDDLRRRHTGGGGKLPPFFSNLLPEGSLRERVARTLGISVDDEFSLLAALGEDLPGAVTATPTPDLDSLVDTSASDDEDMPMPTPREDGVLRFSLAGFQLKLSMVHEGERLTVPASGKNGKWIVKLPSPTYPHLPENEHATMTWAEKANILVSFHELIPLNKLHGVPPQMLEGLQGLAFATRRYDRPDSDRRIHQEDFAQVLNIYPDKNRKYDFTNSETLANITYNLIGEDALRDFVRRLVFVVLSGNGDAHLKNWSLYYPNDINAALSPAYDQVATIQYFGSERLALNLAKTRSFAEITLSSFQRLARKIGADEAIITDTVKEAVSTTRQAWAEIQNHLRVPDTYRTCVNQHLAKLPLANIG